MHQTKRAISTQNSKHFLGRWHSPLSRTLPTPNSLGAFGASTLAPSALDRP